jgi:hypothetical protein
MANLCKACDLRLKVIQPKDEVVMSGYDEKCDCCGEWGRIVLEGVRKHGLVVLNGGFKRTDLETLRRLVELPIEEVDK